MNEREITDLYRQEQNAREEEAIELYGGLFLHPIAVYKWAQDEDTGEETLLIGCKGDYFVMFHSGRERTKPLSYHEAVTTFNKYACGMVRLL